MKIKQFDSFWIYIFLPLFIVFLTELNSFEIKTLQTQTITINAQEMRKAIADCNGHIRIDQEIIDDVLHYSFDDSGCK